LHRCKEFDFRGRTGRAIGGVFAALRPGPSRTGLAVVASAKTGGRAKWGLMNPPAIDRRHFFARSAAGLGGLAKSPLLVRDFRLTDVHIHGHVIPELLA
jgi:hypothetical protein